VLRDDCTPDVVEISCIIATELVANAVQHAGTPLRVAVVRFDDRVRVEVSDASPIPPMRRRYGRGATTGRGVVMVQRLADDWGVDTPPGGKTVWAEIECGER
jgi:anti-sigma regulatory factor (Ser/Thr protein kinase)